MQNALSQETREQSSSAWPPLSNGNDLVAVTRNPNDNVEKSLLRAFESLEEITQSISQGSPSNAIGKVYEIKEHLIAAAFHTGSRVPRKYAQTSMSNQPEFSTK
jgi:hypothetical protein